MPHSYPRFAALLAASALCACNTLGNVPSPQPVDMPARPQPELNSITAALELMRTLPEGDPARQAELFQATKDDAVSLPTTSNKFRFALALATPGHGGSDPVAAQRQLSELLAIPETLLPVERLLAEIELQNVDQRLVMQSENKQLRDDAPREARDKLQTMNRRLVAESDDNARLRKALDEARAKLEAVTHIERSINDRGPTGAHP